MSCTTPISTLTRIIMLILFAESYLSCGLSEPHYVPYPAVKKNGTGSPDICPIDIAAFSTYVAPMLRERCTVSCHMVGGTAERHLVFTGNPEKDAMTLKKQEDGTANGIFHKASGITAHVGGKAAIPSDRERLEKWFAAQKLCPTDPRPSPDLTPFPAIKRLSLVP